MNNLDKIRVLIPHWIEHNKEHTDEFKRWAGHAEEATPDILAAVDAMGQVNKLLMAAMEKLGGPIELHDHDD
jgi:hypothetical protein